MEYVDEILLALEDGEWRSMTEVALQLRLEKSRADKIFGFLKTYDFIEIDEKGEKARLRPYMQTFLKAIRVIEHKKKWRKRSLGCGGQIFRSR